MEYRKFKDTFVLRLCCDLIQNKKFVKVLWLLQRRDILPLQKSAALGLSVLHKLSYMV